MLSNLDASEVCLGLGETKGQLLGGRLQGRRRRWRQLGGSKSLDAHEDRDGGRYSRERGGGEEWMARWGSASDGRGLRDEARRWLDDR